MSHHRKITTTLVAMLMLLVTSCNRSGEPDNRSGEPEKPDIKISDVFRDQMMRFLESAGELDASSGQGVNILTLKEQLAKTKSSYELVAATWPKGFEPDARKSFDEAVRGWDLTIQFWASKISKSDDPVEPNINGYVDYLEYSGNALQTDVHGDSFIVEDYRGKKYIPLSDTNISILLSLASAHYKAGKTSVLAAISQN